MFYGPIYRGHNERPGRDFYYLLYANQNEADSGFDAALVHVGLTAAIGRNPWTDVRAFPSPIWNHFHGSRFDWADHLHV